MAGLCALCCLYNWYNFALNLISMQYALIIYNMMNNDSLLYKKYLGEFDDFVVVFVGKLTLKFSVLLFSNT